MPVFLSDREAMLSMCNKLRARLAETGIDASHLRQKLCAPAVRFQVDVVDAADINRLLASLMAQA